MYRTIPGYPKYAVNDRGAVVSDARGKRRRLRVFLDGRGYPAVDLSRDGVKRKFAVHRLVLLAFVGPCPAGMETRHLDGVRTNNRLTNLCYGTPVENAEDKRRHGRLPIGSTNGSAKLDEDGARQVLWLYENETRNRAEIARRMGVTFRTVTLILHGELWGQALAA
jgi:hypothetical protein